MIPFNVLNLKQWVEENKEFLKPPVNNKEIYPGGEFIIMVVGGPNERIDFHYNETPEFFYQIQGDIILRIIDDGICKEIPIKEGEIFDSKEMKICTIAPNVNINLRYLLKNNLALY